MELFPTSLVHPNVAVVHIDSPLYFLNSTRVTKYFTGLICKPKHNTSVIVIDWSAVSTVDYSGKQVLKQIVELAEGKGVTILHAQLSGHLSEKFKSSPYLKQFLKFDHFFLQLHEAITFACRLADKKKKQREDEERKRLQSLESEPVGIQDYNLDSKEDILEEGSPLLGGHSLPKHKKCVIF